MHYAVVSSAAQYRWQQKRAILRSLKYKILQNSLNNNTNVLYAFQKLKTLKKIKISNQNCLIPLETHFANLNRAGRYARCKPPGRCEMDIIPSNCYHGELVFASHYSVNRVDEFNFKELFANSAFIRSNSQTRRASWNTRDIALSLQNQLSFKIFLSRSLTNPGYVHPKKR